MIYDNGKISAFAVKIIASIVFIANIPIGYNLFHYIDFPSGEFSDNPIGTYVSDIKGTFVFWIISFICCAVLYGLGEIIKQLTIANHDANVDDEEHQKEDES